MRCGNHWLGVRWQPDSYSDAAAGTRWSRLGVTIDTLNPTLAVDIVDAEPPDARVRPS
jgi:hypothetical protein